MADFMKNKAKLIFIIYGIIIALVILGAIIYMTFVTNVHIAYTINDQTGAIEIFDESLFQSTGGDNTALFSYFNNNSDAASPFYSADFAKNFEVVNEGDHNILYYGINGVSFARTIYNFQVSMSSFNTTLLVFGIISLVCFAVMLIFSNQSRRVYYKSNLYIGVLMPLTVAVLSVVALIMNFSLLGEFNKNYDLYRVAAYLQNPNVSKIVKNGLKKDYSIVTNGVDQFGPQGYVIVTVILAIVIIASVFMIVYSIYRYKECAKHRNDI